MPRKAVQLRETAARFRAEAQSTTDPRRAALLLRLAKRLEQLAEARERASDGGYGET